MALPALVHREPSTSRAKTLPAGAVVPLTARKWPQSVCADGSLWVRERPATNGRQGARTLSQLAKMVLPKPTVGGNRWRLVTNVAADFLLVFANFVLVSHLHLALHQNLLWPARLPDLPPFRLGFVILYGALLTLLGYSEGLYRNDLNRDSRDEQLVLLRTVGWASVLAAMLVHLLGVKTMIPLAPVAATALLNVVSMAGWRNWQRSQAARRTQEGNAAKNVLIVGAGRLGHKVARYLEQNAHAGRVVRGFLDNDWSLDSNVLGRVEDLPRIARAEFADEIILTAPPEAALARNAIQQARRIHLDVKLVPELFGVEPRSPFPENFGELPVFTLHEEPIATAGLYLKRIFDLVCSVLGLAVAAPLLAGIALAIRLDSPGPVLYRAPRAGRKGRCFLCYKFRTMVANADGMKEQLRAQNQREGPFFKIGGDPRITRLGRSLRRYSLDEIPQLWNVLKGEMSMVGPRPHPLDDFAGYELEHLRRLDVTPGITGLWQVTARQDPSFLRNLTLDEQYIDHWSLWLDLQIVFKTILVVLRGSGE